MDLAVAGLLALPLLVAGLRATPGSQCADECIDVAKGHFSTNTSDIVCHDDEFSSNESGKRFAECIRCLQDSTEAEGDESDVASLIYNLRYTLSTCLFGLPEPISESDDPKSSCATEDTCLALSSGLAHDNLDPSSSTYEYCQAGDGAFLGKSLGPCLDCLRASSDEVFLSNFMVILTGGCAFRPSPGEIIKVDGDIFSKQEIAIVPPDEQQLPTTTPTANPAGVESKPEKKKSLAPGAIAGIAVAVLIIFIVAGVLFYFYHRRLNQSKQNAGRSTAEKRHISRPVLDPRYHQQFYHPQDIYYTNNKKYSGQYSSSPDHDDYAKFVADASASASASASTQPPAAPQSTAAVPRIAVPMHPPQRNTHRAQQPSLSAIHSPGQLPSEDHTPVEAPPDPTSPMTPTTPFEGEEGDEHHMDHMDHITNMDHSDCDEHEQSMVIDDDDESEVVTEMESLPTSPAYPRSEPRIVQTELVYINGSPTFASPPMSPPIEYDVTTGAPIYSYRHRGSWQS